MLREKKQINILRNQAIVNTNSILIGLTALSGFSNQSYFAKASAIFLQTTCTKVAQTQKF